MNRNVAVRWMILSLVALGGLSILATAGYHSMFSHHVSEDEGYLLLSLQGYMSGEPLYEDVYSQYGPLYYQVIGGSLGLVGASPSHEAGRTLTLSIWLLSSVVLGTVAYLRTRRLILAILFVLAPFSLLSVLSNEPPHPGGLISLMSMTAVGLALLKPRGRSDRVSFLIGLLAGGLLLIKVNVGIFAVAALGFSWLVTATRGRWATAGRAAATAIMVITPFALMGDRLGEDVTVRYAAFVAVCGIGVSLAVCMLRDTSPSPARLSSALIAGCLLLPGLSIIGTLMAGTPPRTLYEYLIIRPLGQPEVFTIPFQVSIGALLWGGASVVAVAFLARKRSWAPLGWIWKLVLATATVTAILAFGPMSFPPFGRSEMLTLSLPLVAFNVLIWPSERPASFPRLFLASYAVLNALHAYPVAGSQLAWSTVPVLGTSLLAFADSYDLAKRRSSSRRAFVRSMASPRMHQGVPALLIIGFTFWLLGPRAVEDVRVYRSGESINLYGARRIRLPAAVAAGYEAIAGSLRDQCSTFVSLPGLNNFYLFAGQRPPTYLNATSWMFLLDAELQSRVVRTARTLDGLCLLRNQGLADFWAQERPFPNRPLMTFVSSAFDVVIYDDGAYQILKRREEGVAG